MTQPLEVDFIVVGAGPAGCALATRLARSPGAPSVALIETGPARTPVLSNVPVGIAGLVPYKSNANYAYETTPQKGLGGRRGYQPRGRGLGGSSLINAMIYTRGQPQDYDGWAALGCAGWAWDDVLPYFKRSETNTRGADAWHGGDGPLHIDDLRDPSPASLAFLEGAIQAGHRPNPDFNGPTQEGVGLYQVFHKSGRRYNAARGYLEAGGPVPNLTILTDRAVRRLALEGRRVIGVVHGNGSDERTLLARREVILSAGAFGSPQILMKSGIGPAEHLRALDIPVVHDAPEVGQNLQDHCDFTANLRSRAPGLLGIAPSALARIIAGIGAYRRHGRGVLTSNVAEAGGFVKSDPSLDRPDLQLHFCISMVDDHSRSMRFGTGMALHVCGLRPESRGEVRLAAPNAEAPLIDPGFLTDDRDMEVLMKGVRIVREILKTPAMTAMAGRSLHGTLDEEGDDLRALIRSRADTIYHPVGTCRMGSDARSVVDHELRVRGIEGLRVADASIMPTLISGNTQAPCAMIGEKAADLILDSRPLHKDTANDPRIPVRA